MTASRGERWPTLPVGEWTETLATLHRWTQIVGKVRLQLGPWINHSWGVALYVTARGLTTGLIPAGDTDVELELDFHAHELRLLRSDGRVRTVALEPKSVADFYAEVTAALRAHGVDVRINPVPSELPDTTPLDQDRVHATYVPEHAHALWQALVSAQRVFTDFRAGFRGKVSPVHFFWGSFDLAVTRFSGREAPPHPGGLPNFPRDIAAEAYSHEVSSAGFWPGNADAPDPIFYSYAYPTPDGFGEATVAPDAAMWLDALGEFVLPYAAVQAMPDPDAGLRAFLRTTYEAAADRAGWERPALDCGPGEGPEWWRERPASGAGGR